MKSTIASILEVVALLGRLDKRGKETVLRYLETELAKPGPLRRMMSQKKKAKAYQEGGVEQ